MTHQFLHFIITSTPLGFKPMGQFHKLRRICYPFVFMLIKPTGLNLFNLPMALRFETLISIETKAFSRHYESSLYINEIHFFHQSSIPLKFHHILSYRIFPICHIPQPLEVSFRPPVKPPPLPTQCTFGALIFCYNRIYLKYE